MRKSNKSGSADGSLMIHSATLKKGENRYRAIYHPLRQKIVAAIHKAGRINVSKLNQKLKEDKSLLSQHLKTLRDASIVISQRDGQHVFYIVNYNQLNKLMKYAKQAVSLRNEIRAKARDLMADREEAARLDAEEPNMTWEQVVKKYKDQGYTGNKLYKKIIESSQKSRSSVNESLNAKTPKKQ
jgi:DNA-binding transcriptional ArsR family regulator